MSASKYLSFSLSPTNLETLGELGDNALGGEGAGGGGLDGEIGVGADREGSGDIASESTRRGAGEGSGELGPGVLGLNLDLVLNSVLLVEEVCIEREKRGKKRKRRRIFISQANRANT